MRSTTTRRAGRGLSKAAWIAIAGASVVTVTLFVLLLRDLRGTRHSASPLGDDAPTPVEPEALASAGSTRAPVNKPAPPADVPQPWMATPENTPPLPEGHIPAWEVNPPRPDDIAIPALDEDPFANVPVPDPTSVNGTRPPRPPLPLAPPSAGQPMDPPSPPASPANPDDDEE